MKSRIIICLFFFAAGLNASAQEFLTPSNTFSHEKMAYLTLSDGTEIEGTIDDIDRKKGLIKLIKVIDSEGKKHELQPEMVSHMYLPPSGLDNVQKAGSFVSDAQRWNDQKLNQDLFSKGYAYFESGEVKIKKDTQILLMQLLNPSFSRMIKVYYDPFANQTAGLGVGGLNLTGGIAKSYFVRKTGGEMIKLEKKNYEKEFNSLYEKCPSLVEKYPDGKWRDLAMHIVEFSNCVE